MNLRLSHFIGTKFLQPKNHRYKSYFSRMWCRLRKIHKSWPYHKMDFIQFMMRWMPRRNANFVCLHFMCHMSHDMKISYSSWYHIKMHFHLISEMKMKMAIDFNLMKILSSLHISRPLLIDLNCTISIAELSSTINRPKRFWRCVRLRPCNHEIRINHWQNVILTFNQFQIHSSI